MNLKSGHRICCTLCQELDLTYMDGFWPGILSERILTRSSKSKNAWRKQIFTPLRSFLPLQGIASYLSYHWNTHFTSFHPYNFKIHSLSRTFTSPLSHRWLSHCDICRDRDGEVNNREWTANRITDPNATENLRFQWLCKDRRREKVKFYWLNVHLSDILWGRVIVPTLYLKITRNFFFKKNGSCQGQVFTVARQGWT